MSQLDTYYYLRCIKTLEQAFIALKQQTDESISYDIYRAACVKEFELILEQTGKLLKKKLKPYFATSKQLDSLYFKDIFRYAAKHSLIELDMVERWFIYRDNGNDTAHNYGAGFAEQTLILLPDFIQDAYYIEKIICK